MIILSKVIFYSSKYYVVSRLNCVKYINHFQEFEEQLKNTKKHGKQIVVKPPAPAPTPVPEPTPAPTPSDEGKRAIFFD